MSQNLAIFDFDGTLTYKDSFLELIKFQKGKRKFYMGFLLHLPVLILYKLKLIPNWKAKQMVMQHFFRGMSLTDFQRSCNEFADNVIPGMLRAGALEKLNEHKEKGDRVLVVSASAENWLKCWTDRLKLELLATKLEVEEGKISGRIAGKNCYGPEKLRRVLEVLNPKDFPEVYVYGDSRGDREILEIATHRFYRRLQ